MKKIDILFFVVSIWVMGVTGYSAHMNSARIDSNILLSEALDRKVAHDKVLDARLKEAMELMKE